jgi:uncharacterized membrane protein YidH (DUF202 family)
MPNPPAPPNDSAAQPERRDPGLQPERTALAWHRTSLGTVVLAALLIRNGMNSSAPLLLAAGLCCAAVAVTTSVAIRVPRRQAVPLLMMRVVTAEVVLAGLLTTAHLVWMLVSGADG